MTSDALLMILQKNVLLAFLGAGKSCQNRAKVYGLIRKKLYFTKHKFAKPFKYISLEKVVTAMIYDFSSQFGRVFVTFTYGQTSKESSSYFFIRESEKIF